MSFLYLTADVIGIQSGGGRVTQEESTALFDLAMKQGEEFICWGRQELDYPGEEPWRFDFAAKDRLWAHCWPNQEWPKLCHIYAGTFTRTVALLKEHDCKITYTAAAHNIDISRQEHELLGIPFNYPHLTDPKLWLKYVGGYLAADIIICPSRHSADCMYNYGCERIEIIPHGVDIPNEVKPLPAGFICGYLGAIGPDKGLIYLLEAWERLGYRRNNLSDKMGDLLVLGGRDSKSNFVHFLMEKTGVSNVATIGWVNHVSDFFNGISLLIQSSASEGFGIEVLEAMAHGRPVLCSDGAGAADVVPDSWRFPARNSEVLAAKIDQFRKVDLAMMGRVGRDLAKQYEWPIIRKKYQEVWRELLV